MKSYIRYVLLLACVMLAIPALSKETTLEEKLLEAAKPTVTCDGISPANLAVSLASENGEFDVNLKDLRKKLAKTFKNKANSCSAAQKQKVQKEIDSFYVKVLSSRKSQKKGLLFAPHKDKEDFSIWDANGKQLLGLKPDVEGVFDAATIMEPTENFTLNIGGKRKKATDMVYEIVNNGADLKAVQKAISPKCTATERKDAFHCKDFMVIVSAHQPGRYGLNPYYTVMFEFPIAEATFIDKTFYSNRNYMGVEALVEW